MEERPAPVTPRGAMRLPAVPPGPKPIVDRMPRDPAEWAAFAKLPAADRAAVYLRSIRTMVLFFTVITAIGLIAAVVLGLLGIAAAHQAATTPHPFG